MLSKNFARCLAKISGDGYLYYRYVRYNNTCKELLEEFRQDMKTEFGDIKLTIGVTNTGTLFIQAHTKRVINRFLEFLPDYRSNVVKVPSQIIRAPEDIKKEYVRALYDDEGCAALRIFNKTNEWKRNVTLASNSKRLLEDIKSILLEFDIKTNTIIKNRSDRCYILGISGRENFIKFKEKIGFKHPTKIKKLDLIILSYKKTYSKNNKGFKEIKKKLGSLFP